MLNRLKNNEIYPFFKSRLHMADSRPFRWVDLSALSEDFKQGNGCSDLELERILYGSRDQTHFSGFTEKRIGTWVNWLGSGQLEAKRIGLGLKEGVLKDAKLDSKKERILRKKLTSVRLREQRKRFRKKIIELGCRVREPFLNVNSHKVLKLNLGAGDENYQGMVKIDWAGTQHLFDDIVHLKKIKNESVDEIYSNHVLEHIPAELVDQTLARWAQVLKPGGVMKLRVPDARQAVLSIGSEWLEVDEFRLKELKLPNYLERESARKGIVTDEMAIQFIFGWSDVMPGFWDFSNQHKSLWTPELARARLLKSGLTVTFAENFGTLQTLAIATKASKSRASV